MRFSLIHLDDDRLGEEVTLLVPGMDGTAIQVPLDALPDFLPLLAQATADVPAATCPACGGDPLGRDGSGG